MFYCQSVGPLCCLRGSFHGGRVLNANGTIVLFRCAALTPFTFPSQQSYAFLGEPYVKESRD